jgi:DNA-directed RNA polymerase specialized sigma24 family protein
MLAGTSPERPENPWTGPRAGGSHEGEPYRSTIVDLPPFQTLVDTHWRDVARLSRALAGPLDGDDVAQQAWVQALAAYPRLTSTRNLRGWLLTITARCATDVHRTRARRPVPVGGAAEVDGAAAGAGGGGTHRASTDGSVGGPAADGPDADLWDAVRDLPERQRTALALRYVADLDHAAVAAALGTTPAATRRLVSDALAALRTRVPTPDPQEQP